MDTSPITTNANLPYFLAIIGFLGAIAAPFLTYLGLLATGRITARKTESDIFQANSDQVLELIDKLRSIYKEIGRQEKATMIFKIRVRSICETVIHIFETNPPHDALILKKLEKLKEEIDAEELALIQDSIPPGE